MKRKNLPKITVAKVMSWYPCREYTEERVRELWAGRRSLDALEILALRIPTRDRLWAVLRDGVLPENDLHELACRFAHAALCRERRQGREPDPRSWAAIKAKRMWLAGDISKDELRDVRAAAVDDAAYHAAAAYAAAYADVDGCRKSQVRITRNYLRK